MTSCGDDDPDPSGNPNNPETPSNPNQPGNGNTKLDSESQKQKLQKTAENFMNEVKKFDEKYLKPALYLLGLTLGWDNIYKLIYKRWDLPILKN